MDNQLLYCAFCGKSQIEVKFLVSSDGDICICDECVAVAQDVINHASESRISAEAKHCEAQP